MVYSERIGYKCGWNTPQFLLYEELKIFWNKEINFQRRLCFQILTFAFCFGPDLNLYDLGKRKNSNEKLKNW
ncbi:hypothetical protein L596_006432 [Steinernema carpocapsae]|uniref:Uncharacterized protein n=1 Tax=Steinernema carpocapsae TaxID=34508 RepID=A0A4U8V4B4_STECR|nr:hypothetical protein L596_006432 [Steinernema carpocapsae]